MDKIPLPDPVRRARPERGNTILDEQQSQINKIFASHKIHLTLSNCFKMWREGEEDRAKDSFIFNTDNEYHGPEDVYRWKMAVNDVYEYIETVTRQYDYRFRVELRNPDRMTQDRLCSPVDDPVMTHIFDTLAPKVCDTVNRQIGSEMRRLIFPGLAKPMYHEGPKRPTFFVLVAPRAVALWYFIEQQIRKAIESVEIFFDVEFDIKLSFAYLYPSNVDHAPPMSLGSLPDPPVNGASIGSPRTDSAGSLGLWVWFQQTESAKKELCFLTCYHVIRDGERDEATRKRNTEHGIGGPNSVRGSGRIQVDYPAYYDSTETRIYLQRTALKSEDSAKSLATLNKYQPKGIGTVIYASGIRVVEEKRMDWALIRVHDQSIKPVNKLPVKVWQPYEYPWGKSELIPDWDNDSLVSGVGEPEPYGWFAKIGRSTGVTAGIVHYMNIQVDFRDSGGHLTYEIGLHNENDPHANLIALKGDSGSMVVNYDGQWIGMIFGLDNATAGRGMAFLTSAKRIIKDVARQSNGGIITLV